MRVRRDRRECHPRGRPNGEIHTWFATLATPAGVPLLLGTVTLGLLGARVGLSGGHTMRLSTLAPLLLLIVLGCASGCGGSGESVAPPTKFTIIIIGNSGGVIRTLVVVVVC